MITKYDVGKSNVAKCIASDYIFLTDTFMHDSDWNQLKNLNLCVSEFLIGRMQAGKKNEN